MKPWEYVVYIDLEAGIEDDRMKNAINNLKEFATVTVLGSYPRFQQPAEVLFHC
jgi:prephenate dehydratase